MRQILDRLDPRRRGERPIDAAALETRLSGLARAARVADGRLPAAAVHHAKDVLARADQRRGLGQDLTVVALAGSTGAGKSSLFNLVVGEPVATVAAIRPTTSEPLAALWTSPGGAAPLLDWLGVPRWHLVQGPGGHQPALPAAGSHHVERTEVGTVPSERHAPAHRPLEGPAGGPPHEVSRAPAVSQTAPVAPSSARTGDPAGTAVTRPDVDLTGLVLIDLPDHDSTESSHRAHVDRLVERVDMMIWVLDPQKYADALVHDAYLKRFARHAEVTVVLLNQVDRLTQADAHACLTHLGQLVAEDGLSRALVLPISARTGAGVGELFGMLAEAAAARRASIARLAADVASAADELKDAAGDASATIKPVTAGVAAELSNALTEAAGVGAVEEAVRGSMRLRGQRTTGWPPIRWLLRVRSDPAERLRLSRPGVDPALLKTSLPSASPVALARVTTAAREFAAAASAGAPDTWVRSSRAVALGAAEAIGPHLDSAVARAELGTPRAPRWWSAVGLLQWLFLIVAAAGGLWLLGLIGMRAFALVPPDPPTVGGLPVPTVMLVAGALIGMVLAVLAGFGTRASANHAARRARAAVTTQIAEVARTLIAEPVTAELATLAEFRVGIAAAQGD
ncbi:MAG: GTPase [Candidatus Nanopelagicales bacterium]